MAAAFGLLVAEVASADASLSMFARDDAEVPFMVNFDQTAPVSLAQSISNGGSLAFGSTDLDLGVLRASTTTGSPAPLQVTQAQAVASFSDTFSFTSGFGGTAFLDWSFDGTISPKIFDNFSTALGQFSIAIQQDAVEVGFVSNLLVDSGDGCTGFTGTCVVDTSIAMSGSLPFLVGPGAYALQTTLVAGSLLGGNANFSSTSRLYLRLPDGVTITSGSGQFLASAAPILAVPEPSVLAMLGLGLAAAGYVGRRRRSRLP